MSTPALRRSPSPGSDSDGTIKATPTQTRVHLATLFEVELTPRETYDPDDYTYDAQRRMIARAGREHDARVEQQARAAGARYQMEQSLRKAYIQTAPLRDPHAPSPAEYPAPPAPRFRGGAPRNALGLSVRVPADDDDEEEEVDISTSPLMQTFFALERCPSRSRD